MKKHRAPALMQLRVSLKYAVLISLLIMLVLIMLVCLFGIPNPNMILIAGLVLCSALFGFGGGGVAGLVMFMYTLYFFSTDHSFVNFTPQNVQKVVVSLIGIVVDMVMVCTLKRTEMAAFEEVHSLTDQLRDENQLLQEISLLDGLTGLRNRVALRQDYPLYQGRDVTVMLLDLDNFKAVNDIHGHDTGDRVLRQTAALLIEQFGKAHCYRYGGDEFLVICPDIDAQTFKARVDALLASRPALESSEDGRAGFSIGYTRITVDAEHNLRDAFAAADARMYAAKQGGKNRAVGDAEGRRE